MNLSFTKSVGVSSNKANPGKSVAARPAAFRNTQRAASLRVKSAATVTANNSAADAQKWIDNWRSTSKGGANSVEGAQQWIDNWRSTSGGMDNIASAQKWIDNWRATQAAPAPVASPSSADITADIAARVAERSAWIASWRAKTAAAPAPAAAMSPTDIQADIDARITERASWIAKWRTQQAAAKRSNTWNAPLLSSEQEQEALNRQLQMATKAEGIEAPEGSADRWGCTDGDAANYDPNKVYDDGSCLYSFDDGF